MAGFKTHIATSTAIGVAYGTGAYFLFDVPPQTCLLAGCLCGVSGMLPDLDSNSGVPIRESTAFAAAVVPMLMLDRFERFGWPRESIILAAALLYLLIRFGLGYLLKRYTVHRGMWHSIPAALTVFGVAFLLCSSEMLWPRFFKAGAVFLGYMSHLVLDEIYSVKLGMTGVRTKRSFGTALKFWGPSLWGNVSCYAKLILVVALAAGDPLLMEYGGFHQTDTVRIARETIREYIHSEEVDGLDPLFRPSRLFHR